MYQDIFTVPAELWLFIIGKQGRRIFMTREDIIVICEQAIDALEEVRSYLVNQGD